LLTQSKFPLQTVATSTWNRTQTQKKYLSIRIPAR
jgi:hypothetical protein